ncbi:lipocalin family protein [Methylobacter sp. S3L5C]|uniref:lipocalin family protein n=1 Tax=Methylobacter sp. S3L5C TaxID=2839024 RepID=UPI001FAC3983|nr:lipocalin family protein [Methylobacter sp. S3L5C]UOA08885.1 lipocalin family protein [Methylobacter sp. S3L5C]
MKKLFFLLTLISALLSGCTGIPEGITVVDGFEVNRYMGHWYEIARLDHRFERGLNNISATYSPRADGGVKVINKGWNEADGKWEQVEGKAYFVEQADKGHLKVSFFGPFYGGYNIIDLDKKDYAYSMITGPDRSYFWILSRTKHLPKATLDRLIEKAKSLGFATDQLIFTNQDEPVHQTK